MVWVVKIGGSLATDKRLMLWLKKLTVSKQSIVIVPGGGPFADQVRDLQIKWQFSDAIAHQMAILAMQQYGLMLAELSSQLECLETIVAIKHQLHQPCSPIVWMPSHNELAQDQVVASWDVTADSLAAWLCVKLNADRLILIKAADLSVHQDKSIETLQQANIVDRAFKEMMANANCPLSIFSSDQLNLYTQLDT